MEQLPTFLVDQIADFQGEENFSVRVNALLFDNVYLCQTEYYQQVIIYTFLLMQEAEQRKQEFLNLTSECFPVNYMVGYHHYNGGGYILEFFSKIKNK